MAERVLVTPNAPRRSQLLDLLATSSVGLPCFGTVSTAANDDVLTSAADAPILIVLAKLNKPGRWLYTLWTELDDFPERPATQEQVGLFLAAVRDLRYRRRDEEMTWLGAVNERWRPLLQEGGHLVHKLYEVWVSPSLSTVVPALDLERWQFRTCDERDVEKISRTSEITRPASEYLGMLVETSAIQPRSDAWAPAVAWTFTYPDNSIGTLWVRPEARRQGLAKAVVQHRLAQMDSGRRALAYVGPDNVESRAVWQSLGFSPGWRAFWTRLRPWEEELVQ